MSSQDQNEVLTNSSLAKQKEEEYVHQVYEEIASHFSLTRYKVSMIIIPHQDPT
jgi:ribosomal protein L20A (L18A)